MSIHGYMYVTLLYYMYTHTCIHTVCYDVCHTYRMKPTSFIDGTDINVKCKCSTILYYITLHKYVFGNLDATRESGKGSYSNYFAKSIHILPQTKSFN